MNIREDEYLDYLSNHVSNVIKAWNALKVKLLEDSRYKDLDVRYLDTEVLNHDRSKYENVEFEPYCDYFYPCEGHERNQEAFDAAWLHHQRNNPHHWQYYLLIEDSGKLVPTDMRLEDIVHMVCDWDSFSYRYPESTACNWYYKNKDNMILSKNTRKIVEDLVEFTRRD